MANQTNQDIALEGAKKIVLLAATRNVTIDVILAEQISEASDQMKKQPKPKRTFSEWFNEVILHKPSKQQQKFNQVMIDVVKISAELQYYLENYVRLCNKLNKPLQGFDVLYKQIPDYKTLQTLNVKLKEELNNA